MAAVAWYLFAKTKFDPFPGKRIEPQPMAEATLQIEAEDFDVLSAEACFERSDYRGAIYAGRAIHVGSDDNQPGCSGDLEYVFHLPVPVTSPRLKMRYADDVAGDQYAFAIDGVSAASGVSIDTGTWDDYGWSQELALPDLSQGLHSLRFHVTDSGSYGMTVDAFVITGAAGSE